MVDDRDEDSSLASLASVVHGAGLFLLGKGFSNAVRLITNILLTRFLGVSLYGIYAYLNVVFSLFTVFTRLGGDKSILRFVPEYEDQPKKRQAIVTIAYGTSIISSSVIAVLVYVSAPIISAYTLEDPVFVGVLRITAIVIPFNTIAMITFAIFKGIERMDYNVGVSSVARPLFRLLFLGGAVVLGASIYGVVAALVVSSFVTMTVALAVLKSKTTLGKPAHPTKAEIKRYYDFSLPLTFNQIGNFLYNRVDILMVGFFLSSSAVGIYNVAVAVSSILSLPLAGFNQLFPSIASRLYHNGQHSELESVYASVTRMTFTIALLPAIAAVVYAPSILTVFGEKFVQGDLVLVLFVLAQLTNCAVGPSGYVLMMSDHQYLTLFNQISSGVFNVFLNYVLITNFGFIGAAVATATVLVIINLIRVFEVWYLENYLPYDRKYLKPILAGVVAGAVMHGISYHLNQYLLIGVGGAAGTASFIATLVYLGIESEDVELLKQILGGT
ncbi:flippase [Halostella sp. JP-L12]|uniref:flippase n=1 Tax=Halostella TaxID=1843185 RepID=UPI000EF77BED|nr:MULTISPECIES: flippase [Halostella]NHN46222.1 flippase [Halostella sp. JP-L12]